MYVELLFDVHMDVEMCAQCTQSNSSDRDRCKFGACTCAYTFGRRVLLQSDIRDHDDDDDDDNSVIACMLRKSCVPIRFARGGLPTHLVQIARAAAIDGRGRSEMLCVTLERNQTHSTVMDDKADCTI